MQPSLKRRLRVLFLTAIFLSGASKCGSADVISQQPKASDVPEANLNTCIPTSAAYTLDITDLSNENNTTKRSCNAKGILTNDSPREMMYRVYRVNHYGAEEVFGEKWQGAGYLILKPGGSTEYGLFHRCTGGNCGEGEWFYIDKISLFYSDHGCREVAHSQTDPHPESVIMIENPCDW